MKKADQFDAQRSQIWCSFCKHETTFLILFLTQNGVIWFKGCSDLLPPIHHLILNQNELALLFHFCKRPHVVWCLKHFTMPLHTWISSFLTQLFSLSPQTYISTFTFFSYNPSGLITLYTLCCAFLFLVGKLLRAISCFMFVSFSLQPLHFLTTVSCAKM